MVAQDKQMQKRHISNRIFIWIGLVSVIACFLSLQIWRNVEQQQELKQELEKVKQEQAEAEVIKLELQAKVDLLNDEEYVLKLARDRAYLSFSNEIIFTIPEENNLLKQEKKLEESTKE